MPPPPPAPVKSQQQLSPQQFLLITRRGAYTTLRVQRKCPAGAGGVAPEQQSPELELVDWSTHLERLIRSLRALHVALGGYYARYYAWLEVGRVCRGWSGVECRAGQAKKGVHLAVAKGGSPVPPCRSPCACLCTDVINCEVLFVLGSSRLLPALQEDAPHFAWPQHRHATPSRHPMLTPPSLCSHVCRAQAPQSLHLCSVF